MSSKTNNLRKRLRVAAQQEPRIRQLERDLEKRVEAAKQAEARIRKLAALSIVVQEATPGDGRYMQLVIQFEPEAFYRMTFRGHQQPFNLDYMANDISRDAQVKIRAALMDYFKQKGTA